MREAIIVGVVVGLLFFAAGVIMTALAIKYATNSLLWDVVLWSGVALMAASVATLVLYIYSQSSGGAFWIPALLVNLGIGAIISGIGYANSTASDVAAQPSITPGILLDVSFDPLPRISPTNGVIHTFEIIQKQDAIEAFPVEHQFNGASEVIDWKLRFPDWPIFGISKCEITSTTSESVFDAVIPLNLKFREMIPDTPGLPPVEIGGVVQSTNGVQMRSGRVMMVQQSRFNVGRIYSQTPYVIYFVNRTKYLVDIEIPPEGKVQDFSKAGADFEQKLNIKMGRTMGLHLGPSPVALKLPPTIPLPTPAPPSMQQKK